MIKYGIFNNNASITLNMYVKVLLCYASQCTMYSTEYTQYVFQKFLSLTNMQRNSVLGLHLINLIWVVLNFAHFTLWNIETKFRHGKEIKKVDKNRKVFLECSNSNFCTYFPPTIIIIKIDCCVIFLSLNFTSILFNS